MSCGFGAVVLVFLIIKHDVDNKIEIENQDLLAEVSLLEEDIQDGQEQLVRVRNTVSELDQQLVTAEGLARRINDQIDAVEDKIVELDSLDSDQQIKLLEEKLKTIAQEKKKLEDEQQQGNQVRRFVGTGNRQYLTGLNLGGNRIVILLDISASMLDEDIVNIIRRKNMSDDTKRSSKKWQRAIMTIEWLTAQLPIQSQYQILTFNTQVKPALATTANEWLLTEDRDQLELVVKALREQVPEGGTSLVKAFWAIAQMDPLPDNVFLLTDGLPTQGLSAPKSNTVSAKDRLELFKNAVSVMPQGIPINVLLWPMEGDPMAASAFWKLALASRGSFISPAKDWP